MSTPYTGKKPMHKHRDLIIAWANGAEIEVLDNNTWFWASTPQWDEHRQYRIMAAPKPDVVEEVYVMKRINGEVYVCQGFHEIPNVKFIWDGETGRLKSAEVLK
jgi:hypothetical protein